MIPVPPAMISAPRAMANGSTPSWLQKVASSEATVASIRWGEIFSNGNERAPAVILIGDLLQEDAVAVENAGRLEDVGGDVGGVRQAAVDLLVLLDGRGHRGRGRERAGDDRRGEEDEKRSSASPASTPITLPALDVRRATPGSKCGGSVCRRALADRRPRAALARLTVR